jgi:hypothetical protein
MEEYLLVKGAAIDASPSFTITDCCCFSKSFIILSNLFLVLFICCCRGFNLGPLIAGGSVSLVVELDFEFSHFGGLDSIATPEIKFEE